MIRHSDELTPRHSDIVPNDDKVSLRRAVSTDADMILEWQRHATTRRYFRNPAIPSPEEHAAWFRRRLAERRGFFAIILCDGVPAGMLHLDALDVPGVDAYDVSILVAPERQGLGIATTAMMLARDVIPGAELRAEIHDKNLASKALFRRAGFEERDGLYVYSPAKVDDATSHG